LDEHFNVSIALEFNDEGRKILASYSAQHIGETLAIVLDNIILMAPDIKTAIPNGYALINQGTEAPWTVEEAGCLTAMMTGMLPFPLEVVNRVAKARWWGFADPMSLRIFDSGGEAGIARLASAATSLCFLVYFHIRRQP
jgi:hypothetical protein